MYFLFSRLMKKTEKTWKHHTRVKTRNMHKYWLDFRIRKEKNESKTLSSPDWNPEQEAGNFSVLLKVVPRVWKESDKPNALKMSEKAESSPFLKCQFRKQENEMTMMNQELLCSYMP